MMNVSKFKYLKLEMVYISNTLQYFTVHIIFEQVFMENLLLHLTGKKNNILVVGELFSDGGEVHGFLDDLPVSRYGFVVDWCKEGPGILMGLQLSQQHSGGNNRKTNLSSLHCKHFKVLSSVANDA